MFQEHVNTISHALVCIQKRQIKAHINRDVQKQVFSDTAINSEKWKSDFIKLQNSLAASPEVKHRVPVGPSTPNLGTDPSAMKTYLFRNLHANVHNNINYNYYA